MRNGLWTQWEAERASQLNPESPETAFLQAMLQFRSGELQADTFLCNGHQSIRKRRNGSMIVLGFESVEHVPRIQTLIREYPRH